MKNNKKAIFEPKALLTVKIIPLHKSVQKGLIFSENIANDLEVMSTIYNLPIERVNVNSDSINMKILVPQDLKFLVNETTKSGKALTKDSRVRLELRFQFSQSENPEDKLILDLILKYFEVIKIQENGVEDPRSFILE